MTPKYKCIVCGMPISGERAEAATRRGYEPTYCSARCSATAKQRRLRAKKAPE